MEVLVPSPEFRFHTAMNAPSLSAPSSPPLLFSATSALHVSAPTSPTACVIAARSRHSSVPFDWEEKPGTPKHVTSVDKFDSFDFDLSVDFPISPEILGKIRPLKPPPRLYSPVLGEQGIKEEKNRGFFSPLRRGRNQRYEGFDPFVVAMVEATKSRRDKGGNFMVEKSGRGWKCRIKEFLLFRSLPESGGRKRRDFFKYGSSSSSSSASSNSTEGSGKGEMGIGVSDGGEAVGNDGGGSIFASEEKRRLSIVQSFSAGKYGVSFFRRRF